jgi:hypothetical protein
MRALVLPGTVGSCNLTMNLEPPWTSLGAWSFVLGLVEMPLPWTLMREVAKPDHTHVSISQGARWR